MMEPKQRAELLKDEYIMLQQFYEEIDSKGLTIKSWAITVALAAIGAGIVQRKEILLAGFFASLMFWYLEAHWRGLSHFFAARIQEIELVFQKENWTEEAPMQVYSTWNREYEKVKDQTFKYMFKRTTLLPHIVIAVLTLLLFFWF
jgi:hypothetical protein